MSSLRNLAVASLIATVTPIAAAAVIVVDKGGLGDFADLQPAIDAAVAGDIVLVHPGDYASMSIGKSLTVIADPAGALVRTSLFAIANLPPGGGVVVRGIDAPFGNNPFFFASTISNCGSPVWLEDCTIVGAKGFPLFNGNFPGFAGLSVSNSSTVVAIRCSFAGGPGADGLSGIGQYIHASGGGPGAAVYDSADVAFYDCVFDGGVPGSPPESAKGGDGVFFASSGKVLLSECSAIGGAGPYGGAGLSVYLPQAVLYEGASSLGGGSGTIQPGASQSLPPGLVPVVWNDAARSFTVSSPVAQGAPVTVDLAGAQGDTIYAFVEPSAGALHVPGIHGFLAIGFPIYGPFILASITDPSGHLSFSAPAPALADPTLEGMTLLIDPLFVNGGTAIFGAPSAFVLVQ